MQGNPQRKGVVIKIFYTKPKKPNSAIRKIAKVFILNGLKKRNILTAIPGQGFTIKKFSEVLVRGGRVRDVPGVRYKLIKGTYDLSWMELINRKKSRSKYGAPKEVPEN